MRRVVFGNNCGKVEERFSGVWQLSQNAGKRHIISVLVSCVWGENMLRRHELGIVYDTSRCRGYGAAVVAARTSLHVGR